jgi:dTDP-4-dehydrorhamnose reductase
MGKIFVTGHRGMVGSALVRALRKKESEFDLILATRDQLDLLDQSSVRNFLEEEKPDVVINAAAKVGGIHANDTYPAEFIHQNLLSKYKPHSFSLGKWRKTIFKPWKFLYLSMCE